MKKETYFEISRHKDINSINNYLHLERLKIVDVVKLEEHSEYLKPLLLIVKKK